MPKPAPLAPNSTHATSPTTSPTKNAFRFYLSKLHRTQDFLSIWTSLSHILNPPMSASAAFLQAATAAAAAADGESAELQASLQWAAAVGKGANESSRLNWGTGGPKPAERVPAGTAGLQSAPSASISSNNSDTATAVPAAGDSASASRRPQLHTRRNSGAATTDDLRPPAMELQDMLTKLEAAGMPAIDISGNELAKAHARYIIGGRINVKYERIFRFEFPERPNALQKFLVTLHKTNTKYPRNITLFHYRNYGSDVGKVLAGIAVDLDSSSDPGADGALSEEEKEVEARRDLDRWLTEELGYPFVEETENVVYRRFLREG
ncbi:unnamed protein product [Tilletia controversa]|nr:unnamed protein product [Tilletia controversa]